MSGHKGISKDNISFKIVDIKRLLNQSQNQHYSFSLGFSLFNWFSIPSLFPIWERTLFSLGHAVTSIRPYFSTITFRHQHWGTKGSVRSEEPPSPSRDTRRVLMYV